MSPPASTSFSFEPLFLVLAAGAVYGYVRLARTVERPSGWRATLFGLGVALVAVHGPLLFFLLPPFLLRPLASFRPLRAFLAVLLIPLVSLGLWALTIYAWHVPAVYDYAAAHQTVHDLEHLSFFVAGLLAWTQLVDPARHERLRRPQRVFFALGMLALSQPLVDVLLFSTGPAYPRYLGAHGISALTDQRLAGVVMMTEQLLTLGICVALLLRPYVRQRQQNPAFT